MRQRHEGSRQGHSNKRPVMARDRMTWTAAQALRDASRPYIVRTSDTVRQRATVLVFVMALVAGAVGWIVTPTADVLESERRRPAAFPPVSAVWEPIWMSRVEDAAADRFPWRETFRTLKALTVLKAAGESDKDGLYLVSGHAGALEQLDAASASACAGKMATVAAMLPGRDFYWAVIPDKSLYAVPSYPGYDPAAVRGVFAPILHGMTEIPLVNALSLDDYYRTDLHWDQSRLTGIVEALGGAMGFDAGAGGAMRREVAGPFSGVYPGQLALPMGADQMVYLTGPALDAVSVSYLDPRSGSMVGGQMYRTDLFTGRDPYDLFLGGGQPLVILENSSAPGGRELVLFRDSFGSSLAPLLAGAYSRITVVDLRYMHSSLLEEYTDIGADADVLFLYSSQVVNHAETLRVN